MSEKFYYLGEDVDTLTREEAIEAIKAIGREMASRRLWLEGMRKIDKAFEENILGTVQ